MGGVGGAAVEDGHARGVAVEEAHHVVHHRIVHLLWVLVFYCVVDGLGGWVGGVRVWVVEGCVCVGGGGWGWCWVVC